MLQMKHTELESFQQFMTASAFFICVMLQRESGVVLAHHKQLSDSRLLAVMPASDHIDPLQLFPGGFLEAPADLFRRSWRSNCCQDTPGRRVE